MPCTGLEEPTTLLNCLQLLASLNQTQAVKTNVITKLKSQVGTLCTGNYLTRFGKTSNNGYLYIVFQYSDQWILKDILQSGAEDTQKYGQYNDLDKKHSDCAEEIARTLVECLPKVFSALYFLYFNVSDSSYLGSIKGGTWSNQYVDGQGSGGGQLKDWLIGSGSGQFMDRKFDQSRLNNNTLGSTVGSDLEMLINHDNITRTNGFLQNALLGLMFLGHWHDSKLGHAILFLWVFCDKVTGQAENIMRSRFTENFQGLSWTAFKSVCQGLKSDLETHFISGFDTKIQAICQSRNDELYSDLIDVGKFKEYLEWIKEKSILYNMRTSLKSMLQESAQWDYSKLQNATTAGPFRYGFVFSKSWPGTSLQSQLQAPVTELTKSGTGSLDKLIRELLMALPPTSLKEFLQYYGQCIHIDNNILDRAYGVLNAKLKDYFIGYDAKSTLQPLQADLSSLLGSILSNGKDYGQYAVLIKEDYIADKVAEVLISMLPQVYSALYFLYFNVSDKLHSIQGGGWSNLTLGDTKENLTKWLTDVIGKYPGLTPAIIPRGFLNTDKFNTSTPGTTLVPYLASLVNHEDPAKLQNALVGMLFICPWHDSMLGHALCFLYYFCDKVQDEALKSGFETVVEKDEEKWTNFKTACFRLKSSLQSSFIGPNAASGLSAVCRQNSELYSSVLKFPEKFKEYRDWLKQTDQPKTVLDNIIDSLGHMRIDADQWTADKLKSALSTGPFRYGFVFKSWTGQFSDVQSGLQSAIPNLNRELGSLKSRLEELQPKTKEEEEGEKTEENSGQENGSSPSGPGSSSPTSGSIMKYVVSALGGLGGLGLVGGIISKVFP